MSDWPLLENSKKLLKFLMWPFQPNVYNPRDDTAMPQREIFLHGNILHVVQVASLFPDCKTFVDMKLIYSPSQTLKDFAEFMHSQGYNPKLPEIRSFVMSHFEDVGSEFRPWIPPDWHEHPRFINSITEVSYQHWALALNSIWKELGRKMRDEVYHNPELYSIIPVENGVIVPGGRFREFYYWDSYWIIRGLLLSGMTMTARGMLKNFFSMVERYGFVPNGGRIYYTKRSQPPLLCGMVESYVEFTRDEKFGIDALPILEQEFDFWMKNNTIIVKGHSLAIYRETSTGPRPESYREDLKTTIHLASAHLKEEHYSEIKAAAMSGMDFSSRWFMNAQGTLEGDLTNLKTRSIVPVELNAYLYGNAKIIADLYDKAKNPNKFLEYKRKAHQIYKAINMVLWNKEEGVWLDYDLVNKQPRNYFVATNLSPLWTKAFNARHSARISSSVLNYVAKHGLEKFPGGIPITLYHTGEQWDFPNVWPPIMYIIIKGLENLNTPESKELAKQWACRWVKSNYAAFKDTKAMFEKYNATRVGVGGGGGEYVNQIGFGWTNGIILEFLVDYFSDAMPQRDVFCQGRILHAMQMAQLFKDSKTFVDMKLNVAPHHMIDEFNKFLQAHSFNPTPTHLDHFLKDNFDEVGKEFRPWVPPDWVDNPKSLVGISDPRLRQWAYDLNAIWKELGRKMIDDVFKNPEFYSIIPVQNPVIVPGGRFREFYYWDSYWIIRGLLYSEMHKTARGMLENLLSMVQRFGLVPNGGRIYYLKRSQPPLLCGMIKSYVDFTQDIKFGVDALPILEAEFKYWMTNTTVEVNGHKLAVYRESSIGPRPESYREDLRTTEHLSKQAEKELHYAEIKAAAMSGMDFSSRWFINAQGTAEGDLTNLKTRSIVPVELNAYLYGNAKIIAEFLMHAKYPEKRKAYEELARKILEAMEAVLWNKEEGVWLDYDLINKTPRNYFAATNLSPLWTKAYNVNNSANISASVLKYIEKYDLDQYPGGVPVTLYNTGEQWDFPNVWPPMQYILVRGLQNLNTPECNELARRWAHRWIQTNYAAYKRTNAMFEKYNAEKFGVGGGGGEYVIQKGFGWTNGVILEFLVEFGEGLLLTDNPPESQSKSDTGLGRSESVKITVLESDR